MDYNDFTLTALKDKLEGRGLSRTGNKSDLISDLIKQLDNHDREGRRNADRGTNARPTNISSAFHGPDSSTSLDDRNRAARYQPSGIARSQAPHATHPSELSESNLVAMCRDNYVAPDSDKGQKIANVYAEYTSQCEESAMERDAAIGKARQDHRNGIARAAARREAGLKEIDREDIEREKKERNFRFAFDQLEVRIQSSSIIHISPRNLVVLDCQYRLGHFTH
jgi:hypothetical protein